MISQIFRRVLIHGNLRSELSVLPSQNLSSMIKSSINNQQSVWMYPCLSVHTSATIEAARRGTRARREAIKKANKKKKVEQEVKKEYIPMDVRLKLQKYGKIVPRVDDTKKPLAPQDDVYCATLFQKKKYNVSEAIALHREGHHPDVFNCPNATVYLYVELSLCTDKANRYIDSVADVVALPHTFPTGQDRRVAAITDCPKARQQLQDIGVHLVGGKEVVKLALDGDIDMTQYDHVISSLDILPDLVPIKGLLKKSFPNPRLGTAVLDVPGTAQRFLTGLKYEANRDKYDLDYATIELPICMLEMPDEHTSANVEAILRSIESHRDGRKSTDLICWAYLKSPITGEMFPLDHMTILGQKSAANASAPPPPAGDVADTAAIEKLTNSAAN